MFLLPPPVFLYEQGIGRFEVMNGQQRLNAIVDFCKTALNYLALKLGPY